MKSKNTSNVDHIEVCRGLYEKSGSSAVYDYANENNLSYKHCKPCEADTPNVDNVCAMCGSGTNDEFYLGKRGDEYVLINTETGEVDPDCLFDSADNAESFCESEEIALVDLFERYDLLPQYVQDLLLKYGEMDDNTYDNCRAFIAELEDMGYTADFGLDALPYQMAKVLTIIPESIKMNGSVYLLTDAKSKFIAFVNEDDDSDIKLFTHKMKLVA
jgi:RNA polymerase subunit RPABC4/transcription elongation factor Spt4